MRRKGLTLTELLVILFVAGLAMGAVVCGLSCNSDDDSDERGSGRRRRSTRVRARICGVKVDALRKTMMVFAAQTTRRDFYPNKGNTGGKNQLAILSRFAYEMGIKGETFVCPATEDDPIIVDENSMGTDSAKGSYSYQTSDVNRRITGETENDVIFIADKAGPGGTMSRNHNNGEFIWAACKRGTYKSKKQNIGRLDNDIYRPDNENADTGFTLRDDSYLLPVDSSAD